TSNYSQIYSVKKQRKLSLRNHHGGWDPVHISCSVQRGSGPRALRTTPLPFWPNQPHPRISPQISCWQVSNEELRGSTPEAAAQVVQWVSFADSDIVPPASTWVFPTLGIMHHNKQATENAKEEMRRILGLLDAHLKTRTFLVGERVTLADITVVCTLL
uniref:GST C-terminal domain-containing protein n=1 Tax=Bos indicus x Bos taurus TaxID=30522 RepID=A0A4W2EN53_BOBOX